MQARTAATTAPGGRTIVKRVDVESDLIHSLAYDEETRILDIRFHGTGTYRYYEVEPEVVEELLDAGSKGQFFNDFIREVYITTKLW